ncbi:hypothetical protein LCGC14_2124470, partial [marine sediment metagenome]
TILIISYISDAADTVKTAISSMVSLSVFFYKA